MASAPTRSVAVTGAVVGAAASWYCMFRSGNAGLVLMAMFFAWVGAPYGFYLLADKVALGWSAQRRRVLDLAMIAVVIASLAVYAGAMVVSDRRTKFFLLVPAASLTVLFTAFIAARRRGN